ncbi:MAG: hypothetical protein GX443_01835 [Deltaproteobacteria bacterium]|nr:hypothetical protein [Deltaproteobacteria bacterium]
MTAFVLMGVFSGALLAYAATKPTAQFRKKLILHYEEHARQESEEQFIQSLVRDRKQWIKSISLIRKPFRNEVNIAVETGAFILAMVGVFNAVVQFDRYFRSTFQGEVVIVALAAVAAFLPVQWILGSRIEKDMEAVFTELKRAVEAGQLKSYMEEAKKRW